MEFNPSRLALARRRRGLTQRALSRILECDERTVRKWEVADRIPADEHLALLSRHLDFPEAFFFRSEIDTVPVETVSFRALSRMKASDRNRAIAGGELAVELQEWMAANFTLPAPDLPDLREHRGSPEGAAMALRAAWALGDRPIKSMVELLEFHGVRVFSLAEDCLEIDAYSFWRADVPFILLNTIKSSERSRFDAAHELGHLVMHQHGEPTGRTEEREADAFAAAFLMPRSSVVAHAPRVASIPRLIEAKKRWTVSVAALAHRMHEVGLITDWQYRSLCIQLQKSGIRKNEPESAPRESSQVLKKVFDSLRMQGQKKSDLAEQLGWSLQELNALVFGLVIGAIEGGSSASGNHADREHLQLVK